MKSSNLTFINGFSVFISAILIAIPLTILVLSSQEPEQSAYFGDNSSNKIESESLRNSLYPSEHNISQLNKEHDCDDLKDSSKSEANLKLNLNTKIDDDGHKKWNESDILLYRKRRYLLFPEGSSFQIGGRYFISSVGGFYSYFLVLLLSEVVASPSDRYNFKPQRSWDRFQHHPLGMFWLLFFLCVSVFDLIIPIVDYTNYAIMGITCAVAWELPSKPPSEIEEDLIDKLNDGTLGLSRNDSIDNIKYVDTPHHQKLVKEHLSKIIYIQPSEYEYQGSIGNKASYNQPQINSIDRKEYNYNTKYTPRPVYNNIKQKQSMYYTNPYNNPPFKLKSINNERIDIGSGKPSRVLWKSNYAKRPAVKNFYKQPSQSRPRNAFPKRKQHAVYHIMGKRSTGIPRATSAVDKQSQTEDPNPLLEKLDQIHLRYHRTSRHAMYSKVEAMLTKKGRNGTECILRALCETGQKRHETHPGGLVQEILRAIFTLPEADAETGYHPKHRAWDEAHWKPTNCSDTYPLCEDFIWNSE